VRHLFVELRGRRASRSAVGRSIALDNTSAQRGAELIDEARDDRIDERVGLPEVEGLLSPSGYSRSRPNGAGKVEDGVVSSAT